MDAGVARMDTAQGYFDAQDKVAERMRRGFLAMTEEQRTNRALQRISPEKAALLVSVQTPKVTIQLQTNDQGKPCLKYNGPSGSFGELSSKLNRIQSEFQQALLLAIETANLQLDFEFEFPRL
jgi:hypothetical protein